MNFNNFNPLTMRDSYKRAQLANSVNSNCVWNLWEIKSYPTGMHTNINIIQHVNGVVTLNTTSTIKDTLLVKHFTKNYMVERVVTIEQWLNQTPWIVIDSTGNTMTSVKDTWCTVDKSNNLRSILMLLVSGVVHWEVGTYLHQLQIVEHGTLVYWLCKHIT